ncbi:MAG: hypothetical protein ACF8MF_10500 [Phycisphaerales bacterium JB052]
MSTCCPNCSSTAAIGNDIASACTDCASVSLAGGSMSMTMLVGIIGGTIALAFLARAISRLPSRRLMLKRAHA